MIDALGNFEGSETGTPLQPPRFDLSSKAVARPVEPIPNARLRNLKTRFGSFRQLGTSQMGVLAVVVILGLATGALGGIMLAGRNQQALEPPAEVSDRVSELPSAVDNQKLDAFGAELNGVSGLTSEPAGIRVRKFRPRVRVNQQPRAYRVAVIRE